VWQNHGLQLDQVPAVLNCSPLPTSPQSDDGQRSEGQLIYTVQFHLEKSFEDWNKEPYRVGTSERLA